MGFFSKDGGKEKGERIARTKVSPSILPPRGNLRHSIAKEEEIEMEGYLFSQLHLRSLRLPLQCRDFVMLISMLLLFLFSLVQGILPPRLGLIPVPRVGTFLSSEIW